MLARVPGPADFAEMDETISAYATPTAMAATIGTVACPPQVTMFRLGASRCVVEIDDGNAVRPDGGRREVEDPDPGGSSAAQFARWAAAEVASKTSRTSANSGIASSPSIPSAVVAIPSFRPRASRRSLGRSDHRGHRERPVARMILIIRSVPMLPGR